AKISYEGEHFGVTSITSYDTLEEILTGDAFDFLPIPESLFFNLFGEDWNQSQFLDVEAISQELRIQSPDDEPLFWMFGGYLIATDRYISTGNMADTGAGVFPVFRTPSANPANPQRTFLADVQENFAWAAFANLGYEFTPELRIDGSLRYDRDSRENVTLTPTAFLPNVP